MNTDESLGYGLVSEAHLDMILDDVCNTLGNGGNNNASIAGKEVVAQETLLGTYPDSSVYGQGAGLFQFDEIGFDDVVARVREKDYLKVLNKYRIDIKKVKLRDLDFNPLTSAIFWRLKYLKITASIPKTLEGRAQYWKDHHNSEAGAGEPEEYINNANRLIYNKEAA
ncbi:hypothetical protein KO527_05375 [Pseudoalteromonas sp. C2R02]|uniref:hypothetical protein n=1 Tax=Pseudoalteromonas sp. C2R02 TaxID=2841565 RepID=UPI001C088B10|nr:hypothetical protein [Pseudoalteromonas sp. C2R02]MBU2968779.1 hypothetical protein [Pseudoalteromonas sp. C2R02]